MYIRVCECAVRKENWKEDGARALGFFYYIAARFLTDDWRSIKVAAAVFCVLSDI